MVNNLGSVEIDVEANLTEFRRSLERGAKVAIRNAEKKIPNLDVETNLKTATIRAQVEKLRATIAQKQAQIDVGLAPKARAAMERDLAVLRATVLQKEWGIKVAVDKAAAAKVKAEAAALKTAVAEPPAKVKVAVDKKSVGLFRKALAPISRFSADPQRTLIMSALALAPVITEVGIAATGAAAGLGAMGVAAVTAAVGFNKLLADGDVVGERLRTSFSIAKDAIEGLGVVTARGMAPGLERSLTVLTNGADLLRGQFSALGPVLGNITANLTEGLVGLLIQMEPLTLRVAAAVESLSARFARFGTGGGGAAFVDRMLKSFDQIMPVLKAFGSLFGNILGGVSSSFTNFAPIVTSLVRFVDNLVTHFRGLFDALSGGGATTRGFSKVLDAVLGILDAFIGGIVAGVKVFKPFFKLLGNVIGAFGDLLQWISPVTEGIAEFIGWFLGGAGVVGKFGTALKFVGKALNVLVAPFRLIGKVLPLLGKGFGIVTKAITGIVGKIPGVKLLGKTIGFIGSTTGKVFGGLASVAGNVFDAFGGSASKKVGNVAKEIGKAQVAAALGAKDFTSLSAALNSVSKTDRVRLVGQAMSVLRKETGLTKGQFDAMNKSLGVTRKDLASGKVSVDTYAAAARTLARDIRLGGPAAAGFAESLNEFANSAATAADRSALLGSFLVRMRGDALGNAGAMLAAKQGIQGVKDALAALGPNAGRAFTEIANLSKGSADLGTAMGKDLLDKTVALQNALQGQSDSAFAAAQRLYEVNLATMGTDGAARVAAKSLGLTYKQLLNTAAGALGSEKAAKNYLAQLGLIPPDAETVVKLFGTEKAETILSDIRNLLSEIGRGRGWNPKVDAKGNAEPKLKGIKAVLDSLKDKIINVTTRERRERVQQGGQSDRGNEARAPKKTSPRLIEPTQSSKVVVDPVDVPASTERIATSVAKSTADGVKKGVKKAAKRKNFSASSALTNVVSRWLSDDVAAGLLKGVQGLDVAMKKLGTKAFNALSDRIKTMVAAANTALKLKSLELGTITKKLETARERLEEINQFAKGVADSLTGTVFSSQIRSTESLLDALTKQNQTAKAFAKVLKDLKALGLSDILAQQLVDAGPEGLQAAQALAASGAQAVAQANALAQNTQTFANQAGQTAAELVKGMGTAAAQAVVTGLLKDKARIETAMKNIARTLIAQVTAMINNALRNVRNKNSKRIPGFAGGVRNFSGGLAVVGEEGPELLNLPRGSNVFSNDDSRKMVAAGSSETNLSVTQNFYGPQTGAAQVREFDWWARYGSSIGGNLVSA